MNTDALHDVLWYGVVDRDGQALARGDCVEYRQRPGDPLFGKEPYVVLDFNGPGYGEVLAVVGYLTYDHLTKLAGETSNYPIFMAHDRLVTCFMVPGMLRKVAAPSPTYTANVFAAYDKARPGARPLTEKKTDTGGCI